jgi:hypothetical protein
MGLLKHLLFWPVTGPLFLTEFAFDKVQGVVREELTDDTRIKAELMELQLMLELGDIDDDEYVRRETEVMGQLRDIRHWREQFGMGVSGGPVRVATDQNAVGATTDERTVDKAVAESAAADPDAAPPRVADAGAGADFEVHLDWE